MKTTDTLQTERLLSIEDLAAVLNIPVKTLRNLRAAGKAPKAVKIGGSVRWRPSTVEKYLEELERAA